MGTTQHSWGGSEHERRAEEEKGTCLPPQQKARDEPRFLVRAGTTVQVSRLTPLRWVWHTTQKDLGFERYEAYKSGVYEFRHEGWYLRVHRGLVVHRADRP